jgi:hypothetical protein
VAATYDGQEIKLYLDGALENSLPAPGLVVGTNDLPLSMGAQDDGVRPFDGTLDEVRLYDYALTQAEIQDLIATSQGLSPLQPAPTTTSTGEKPQSKVWLFDNTWWTVFPDTRGSWLRRLDGDQWTDVLQLSSNPNAQADYELDQDLAHVLLFDGSASQLASLQYVPGSPGTYQFWPDRPGLVSVPISDEAETSTITLDGTGRMWMAYDTSDAVKVRYSDRLDAYASWSDPISLASEIDPDDIAAVGGFDGKIGVMWSSQQTRRFGFRVHVDGDPPTLWGDDEVPASQSAADDGNGMADDHMNLAVASDGTIYAAVKTGFNPQGHPLGRPEVALLVRRPSGSWDDMYAVDTDGTRPIVVLNEALDLLIFVYVETEGWANIKYRTSDASQISFGDELILMAGSLSDPSSTKQTFVDELIVIATTTGANLEVRGVSYSP